MKNRLAAFFHEVRCMGYARKRCRENKEISKRNLSAIRKGRALQHWVDEIQELAKEAKAVYKIDKVALVNCEIFEKYLETFRIA